MGTPGYDPPSEAPEPVPAGCGCICHTEKGVMHIQACCQPCRSCGKLVAIETREAHERTCPSAKTSP